MSAVPADLIISPRWILPMTSRDVLLEGHALVIRDGRILDLLPAELAAVRYAATVHVDRPEHLLLPGLIDACAELMPDAANTFLAAAEVADSGLLHIAAMLRAGTSCFCTAGYYPDQVAGLATTQGMRAVIGIPLTETASRWAQRPGDYLTRALNFRDEFAGHPTLATAFAPLDAAVISDDLFSRIATLANELDAGVLISLHESAAAVADCLARHGLTPIDRLHRLGMLTPALVAANMVHVSDADLALAQRSGIAVTLCPESNLRAGFGPPPVAAWARTGLRLGTGSGSGTCATTAAAGAPDLWSALRLLALLAIPTSVRDAAAPAAATGAALETWDALATVTRGAAAALGLDNEIGSIETGKWADLCCIDLRIPGMLRPGAPAVERLVFGGGRDLVSDVWVSGRHLLNERAFTRLDWSALAARIASRSVPV
jgi:5-methylthioadenosine/S-adenosylhomocysteine deaminase